MIKRLLVASLALAGTMSMAHADILTVTALGVWGGDTPGATATSANQQALPGTRGLLPLLSTSGASAASGSINLNAPLNIIGSFLGSGSPTPVSSGGCTGTCLTSILSTGGFAHATLFEFEFTIATAGTLSVAHDDGVSLFADGGGGNNPVGSDLFPVAASAPTSAATAGPVSLAPGTYDLFYESGNGLPEILQTTFTPSAVPEPASVALLGSVMVGLAWLGRRRRNATS
jgi:hypothetical protein